MSSDILQENLDAMAEAAGGVERLRDLILHLAVHGKLAEQNSDDNPAQSIVDEWNITCVNVKGPSVLPANWKWCQVGEAGEVKLGRQRSPDNHQGTHMVPYLRVANVHEARFDFSDVKEMNFTPHEQQIYRLLPKDVLLNEGQSYELVGRPAMYQGEVPNACFQNTLLRFRSRPGVVPEYALTVFRSYMRNGRFRKEAQQTTNIAHISASRLSSIEFPLPPTSEQERIVAKVDELMALCDELEQKQGQRHTIRRTAHTSALEALTKAQTPDELAHAWERLQKHWDVLAAHSDAVPPLRQTILQLAVQGHLLPQDPKEESANRWLAQQGVAVRNDAQAQDCPVGWVFAALGELGEFCGGGTPPKGVSRYWEGDIPWISPKDMKRLRIGESIDTISQEAVAETAVKMIPSGALLMVVRGMILAHSFPVAITTRDLTVNQDMKALVLKPTAVADYLLLALRGNKAKVLAMVERSTHGTCRLDSLDLARLRIGIPPLAEQKRIVARVDELMALCDSLEQCAREQETLASQLAHAAVAAVATG